MDTSPEETAAIKDFAGITVGKGSEFERFIKLCAEDNANLRTVTEKILELYGDVDVRSLDQYKQSLDSFSRYRSTPFSKVVEQKKC